MYNTFLFIFLASLGALTAQAQTAPSITTQPADTTVTVGQSEGTLERYGTTSTGVDLYWKVFLPTSEGTHPAVLVLHAGAFKTGNRGPDSVAQDLAIAGFVAFSTEYRLAPPHVPLNSHTGTNANHPVPGQDDVTPVDDGHYPEQSNDVSMAIRAARSPASTSVAYGHTNGTVYGIGGSAGGFSCGLFPGSWNAGCRSI